MSTHLTETALERDTYSIQVSFYDVDQTTAVTPNSISWTLTDAAGNVINSRSAVSLTPATSVWIELTDADLALTDGNSSKRYVLVTGSYNSGVHGSNRKINREFDFTIEKSVTVT